MENKGFTIVCNGCGQKSVYMDGFDRFDKDIYISTFMSCDIKCENCNNQVEEKE